MKHCTSSFPPFSLLPFPPSSFFPFLLFSLLPLLLSSQDTLSFGGIYDLPGAEVRAQYTPISPLAQRFTIEEVYRLPGTFYDPARLVALLPGVVQTNDQANHLSVRGNTPNANLWRINGLAIVNPNHTANAGTFYDFPTLSGGGVNAISAQMLDNSGFLAGGLPVEYGHATGGTFDLRLRPGSKAKRKYQLQAGFIGFDGMAEGPIGKSGKTSYLVNGRYSFTGLLADMGVDFGGEEIRFADFNGHLHHRWDHGEISLFGVLGRSSNDFAAPDPLEEELEEQKELFDIDYTNDVNILGASYYQQLGAGTLQAGVAYSSAMAERDQREANPLIPIGSRAEFGGDFSTLNANVQYISARDRVISYRIGAEFLTQKANVSLGFTNAAVDRPSFTTTRGNVESTVVTPFVGYNWKLTDQLSIDGGLRFNFFFSALEESFISPRLKLQYQGQKQAWILATDFVSAASLLPMVNAKLLGNFRRQEAVNTVQLSLRTSRKVGRVMLQATAFVQRSENELASRKGDFILSANNLLEVDPSLDFTTQASTRRYGLELEAGGGLKKEGWYYRGNLTLLNAETKQLDGNWSEDRYAANFIGKFTLGREWAAQDRKQRPRTYGLNLALIAFDGERYGRVVDSFDEFSIRRYFAAQVYNDGLVNEVGTYFRPDLRLYKTKTRTKTTTTLALDIQNVAGVQNVGNVYYDAFLERPQERLQLGLIPVLSYRILWR